MAQHNNNNDFNSGKQDPFEDTFSTENSVWTDPPQENVNHSNYNPFRDNVNDQPQYSPSNNLIDADDFIDLQQDPQSPSTSNFNSSPTAISSAHLSNKKGLYFYLICYLLIIE